MSGAPEPAVRLPNVDGPQLPIAVMDEGVGTGEHRILYWRQDAGDGWDWWIYLPGAGIGRLKNHTVTEHEDGTITVTPSIALSPGRGADGRWGRHGFLTRGIWREC